MPTFFRLAQPHDVQAATAQRNIGLFIFIAKMSRLGNAHPQTMFLQYMMHNCDLRSD